MSVLTYLIDAQQRDTQQEIDGKVLTRPTLSVTDGLSTTYACDVDIGITNQQGNDQSANLLNTGSIGSVLHNVPIARGNMDVIYADAGAAVRLRRSTSGRYEIIGFSKQMPGTYIRVPVDLEDFTFGQIEDLSIMSRAVAYADLVNFGGYGTAAYGAIAIYQGTNLIKVTA
jgi:hypothetical protein